MNLYIGKEKETLYDIAQKYNLTFEELVQFNKSYRFKMDLKDCPVLIPTKEKRVINMPNSYDKKFFYDEVNKFKDEFDKSILAYFISEKFGDYMNDVLLLKYKNLQKLFDKFKNKNPLKITASLEVKNIVELFNSFIKSIIEKDFDNIKLTLQEMNKWPEKFSDRFLDKYKDKLVVSFKKLIEEIRDYILNIGNEDYNESFKNKDKIALLLDEITKILFD